MHLYFVVTPVTTPLPHRGNRKVPVKPDKIGCCYPVTPILRFYMLYTREKNFFEIDTKMHARIREYRGNRGNRGNIYNICPFYLTFSSYPIFGARGNVG